MKEDDRPFWIVVTIVAGTAGIHTAGHVVLFIAVSLAILILPRWTPAPA